MFASVRFFIYFFEVVLSCSTCPIQSKMVFCSTAFLRLLWTCFWAQSLHCAQLLQIFHMVCQHTCLEWLTKNASDERKCSENVYDMTKRNRATQKRCLLSILQCSVMCQKYIFFWRFSKGLWRFFLEMFKIFLFNLLIWVFRKILDKKLWPGLSYTPSLVQEEKIFLFAFS